jgi:hypothetical protein
MMFVPEIGVTRVIGYIEVVAAVQVGGDEGARSEVRLYRVDVL